MGGRRCGGHRRSESSMLIALEALCMNAADNTHHNDRKIKQHGGEERDKQISERMTAFESFERRERREWAVLCL